MEDRNPWAVIVAVILLIALALSGIGGCMYWYPQYNVYSSRLEGEAELAKANGNRQAKVAEAKAADEAAIYQAQATGRRMEGWVTSAVAACKKVGQEGNQTCIDKRIEESKQYSIAHDGHEGVIVAFTNGGGSSVAVNAGTMPASEGK